MAIQTVFDSPFKQYLHTNCVPSDRERAHILEILSDPEAKLLRMDENISRAQNLLDAMKQEKEILANTIHAHRRLLAPLRALPDDLLCGIFLQCLPTPRDAVMNPSSAPLVLVRVCRRWRSVALATPRLWATLHVSVLQGPSQVLTGRVNTWDPAETLRQLEARYEENVEQRCAAIHTWLSRSGSCPLSLSIRDLESPHQTIVPGDQLRYHKKYLDVFLCYSQRWQTIRMKVYAWTSAMLTGLSPSSFPMLKNVYLSFENGTHGRKLWEASPLLNSPTLESVYVRHIPFSATKFKVDWTSLSRLSLSYAHIKPDSPPCKLTMREAYHVLTSCPNLVDCRLDIIDNRAATIPPEPIFLHRLETLSIRDGCPLLTPLFECLDVPHLRTVTYHTVRAFSRVRPSPLIALLSRTANCVVNLSMNLRALTRDDLVSSFCLAPNLLHLKHEHVSLGSARATAPRVPFNVMKAVLDLLAPISMQDAVYLPHLEIIDITDPLDVSDVDVRGFIEARQEAGKTGIVDSLKAINITFRREQQLDVLPFLQDYIHDGLKVAFTYPVPRMYLPERVQAEPPKSYTVSSGQIHNVTS